MSEPTLFGPEVARAIADLQPELPLLAIHTRLRKALGQELGRQASELVELRKRAVRKLGVGLAPFVTRKGLEQASHPQVAALRARRVAGRASQIWDATSGIGLDSLALSSSKALLAASDLDHHTARCAQENLAQAGFQGLVLQANARQPPFPGQGPRPDGVLIDPDRRAQGERSLDPESWSPSLSQALELAHKLGGGCLKLSPALDPRLIDALPDCRAEWTSFEGSLAEVTLWVGPWAMGPGDRAAVAIDRAGQAQRLIAQPSPIEALTDEQAAASIWLAEPDPAIIRSGLLGALASHVSMRPLAPQLAYLGGPERPPGPFLRSWRVLDRAPLDPKKVRHMLGKHDIGAISVRKRGHPDPAETLARRFAGPGTKQGHLAIARLAKGHLALLLEPGDGLNPHQMTTKGGMVGDEGFEPPTSSV